MTLRARPDGDHGDGHRVTALSTARFVAGLCLRDELRWFGVRFGFFGFGGYGVTLSPP
jgi:hypothetical protein